MLKAIESRPLVGNLLEATKLAILQLPDISTGNGLTWGHIDKALNGNAYVKEYPIETIKKAISVLVEEKKLVNTVDNYYKKI